MSNKTEKSRSKQASKERHKQAEDIQATKGQLIVFSLELVTLSELYRPTAHIILSSYVLGIYTVDNDTHTYTCKNRQTESDKYLF